MPAALQLQLFFFYLFLQRTDYKLRSGIVEEKKKKRGGKVRIMEYEREIKKKKKKG